MPSMKVEQLLKHQADILEAELSRLNGEPAYSTKQVREMLKEKYHCAQVQDQVAGTVSHRG